MIFISPEKKVKRGCWFAGLKSFRTKRSGVKNPYPGSKEPQRHNRKPGDPSTTLRMKRSEN
ncbi:hypothetical protein DN748_09040 [Sinomicrobium soli]|nr:hypothetical protein DN748_09040 [Sinomicrobium sp. N-1-3-6]